MSYISGLGLLLLIYGYFIICWIVNIVQLFKCDFASPYKDEIIHAIGVFIPPLSGITVWL